jgi:hypothetical protein
MPYIGIWPYLCHFVEPAAKVNKKASPSNVD